jgi:Cu(I)-responsive transcriptional regulator
MVDRREASMETMRIGELAERAGVSVQAVRYYERRALLPEPPRSPSGYRKYSESHLDRLRFVKRGQELGFTLAEIEELLSLRADPHTTADQVKRQVEDKLRDLDRRVRDLEGIRKGLRHLAGQCEGGEGPTGDCPLLVAMGPLEDRWDDG